MPLVCHLQTSLQQFSWLAYCLDPCFGLNFRDWASSAPCSQTQFPPYPRSSRNDALLRSSCAQCSCCIRGGGHAFWPVPHRISCQVLSPQSQFLWTPMTSLLGVESQSWLCDFLPCRALWGSATARLCPKGDDGWLVLPSDFPRCAEFPSLHFWLSGCNWEEDCHPKGEKGAQRPNSGRTPASTSAWPEGLQEVAQALWWHSSWPDSEAPGRLGPILQKP